MSRLGKLLEKQGKFLLENYWHALGCAVVFAILPFTVWLSLVVVALVTLRKGWLEGGFMLAPVMIAYYFLVAPSSGVIGIVYTGLTFLPCYVAAYILRCTVSWRAVAGIFFLQLVIIMGLLQTWAPDFIIGQYKYLQAVLNDLQSEGMLIGLMNGNHSFNSTELANYLLGLQGVGVILSAIFSLGFARYTQSLLYYPGEFNREMLNFRVSKLGFFLLLMVLVAAAYGYPLAINSLPLLMLYFLFAGLSLSFSMFTKKPVGTFILLVVPIFIVPLIILPFYVIFGSLDSLFNFRSYLPRSGKS